MQRAIQGEAHTIVITLSALKANARSRSAGALAALVLVVWYAATMSRDLAWFDSGELALVARQLGIGHPPGQPLYVWLSAFFMRLPGLHPLTWMTFLSALSGALCALPADNVLRRTVPIGGVTRFVVLVAAGAVAPIWDQATVIELYATATFLFLTIIALAIRISDHASRTKHWLALGLLGGLLGAINPVFALAAGVAALLLVRRRLRLRFFAAANAGLILGLLPYVHLYFVRNATDRIVWGELTTWDGVRAYLLGADYAHKMHSAYGLVPRHLGQWIGWSFSQAAIPVFLGLFGWLADARLRRHASALGIALLVGFGFTLTYGTYHPAIIDFNGYLAPALWLSSIGVAGLVAHARGAGLLRRILPATLALNVLVASLVLGERPVWTRTRANVRMPRELAQEMLDAAEPGALLVVESDHVVFPLLYLNEVEGRRPDVVVVNIGWGSSGWYWRHLFERHPDLPRISLSAPDRETRLRRLIVAAGRPARAENTNLAARLGIAPCPATWGFALGPTCTTATDDEARFLMSIAKWWTGDEGRELISPMIIANVATSRAEGLWLLGDAAGALRAWRAGTGLDLPLPERLPADRRPRVPILHTDPVFLGSPARSRDDGARALELLGRPDLAKAWRNAGL